MASAAVALHDVPISQHAPNHVLRNLRIVFYLTAVLVEESASDFCDSGSTIPVQRFAQHYRLVDVRHPHVALHELSNSSKFMAGWFYAKTRREPNAFAWQRAV